MIVLADCNTQNYPNVIFKQFSVYHFYTLLLETQNVADADNESTIDVFIFIFAVPFGIVHRCSCVLPYLELLFCALNEK